MGGGFVFIIMFSFMIRVAPPWRHPINPNCNPGAAHLPLHPLCSGRIPWCHVPCAVHLCLLAQETWRSSSRCAGVLLELEYTQVKSSLSPPPGSRQAPANRIVVPGGPYQYYAVHQYSVVRRVWGPGGLPVFLNFGASRPPRNLVDVILTAPVRCSSIGTA
jgi:hypothetical protein